MVASHPSTAPLQEPGSTQDNSSEKRMLTRLPSERQPRHETTSSPVVGKSQSPQQTLITDQLLGSDNRVGRFHNWMGMQLPGKEHGWSMDTTGENLPHQLSRALGSLSSPKVICSAGEINLNSPSIGQCDSHCVFEQDGRYSLKASIQIGSTGLVERNITIHAEHLPGKQNVQADWESRHVMDSSNWRLHREIFLKLQESFGPFTVDLFASQTNAQLPVYCSWKPDPAALTVDALSI